jgi:hypothetical protein
MGYPMTWQRFIKRNQLGPERGGGDYSDAGAHKLLLNLDRPGLGTLEELQMRQVPHMIEYVKQLESRYRTMLGDLRRLEMDSTDENAVCNHIVAATGIEPDSVATVLKEFFAW